MIFMDYEIEKNYNSLDRIEKWDEETRDTIRKRIAEETGDVLSYGFLTEREGEVLEILADTLIPQEKNKNYVKISEIIDRDLARDKKAVRYGKNPWPREFYKKGLVDFEKFAKREFGKPIEDFSASQLENLIKRTFSLDAENFLARFMRRVLSDATAIYFSHPASWNAIGFPGPAYPEGYPYLGCGEKEDWEPRYEKLKTKI